MTENAKIRHMLTRLSLAIVFIGIGIWEVIQPSYWAMYVPPFVSSIIATDTFLMFHGSALIIIGTAVLLGIYLRFTSALAALTMLSIILSVTYYLGFSDIVLRDIAIFVIAVALFFDDSDYARAARFRGKRRS